MERSGDGMNRTERTVLSAALIGIVSTGALTGARPTAAGATAAGREKGRSMMGRSEAQENPTMRLVAGLIGGTWRGVIQGPDRPYPIEETNEWGPNQRIVRSRYVFDRGGSAESEGEAFFGWDAVNKT